MACAENHGYLPLTAEILSWKTGNEQDYIFGTICRVSYSLGGNVSKLEGLTLRRASNNYIGYPTCGLILSHTR